MTSFKETVPDVGSEAPKTYTARSIERPMDGPETIGIPKLRLCQKPSSRPVNQRTITVITDNNNLVLDTTRNVSHRVPNRGNLLVNCRHQTLRAWSNAQGKMVYHGL